MHQTGPIVIMQNVTHRLDIYQVCHNVGHWSLCLKWELFFIRVKTSGQYCCNILLSQQMLDAVKCITDDNLVFQLDSSPLHLAFNCCSAKLSNLLSPEL